MNTLKKEQLIAIILSSICIVFGVLFCAIPLKTLSAIETIVCVVLLVYGVVCIMSYCLKNSEEKNAFLFFKGIISAGLGLLIMFVGMLFVICLGLILAFSGVVYITTAIDEKREKDKSWWVTLLIGIAFAMIGIAVAILYNTNLAKSIIMIVFGIGLILDGVVRLIYTFVVHKQIRLMINKKVTEKAQSIEVEFEVKSAEDNFELNTESDESFNKNQEKIEEIEDNNETEEENTSSDEGFV